jgi:hypothetical protein
LPPRRCVRRRSGHASWRRPPRHRW